MVNDQSLTAELRAEAADERITPNQVRAINVKSFYFENPDNDGKTQIIHPIIRTVANEGDTILVLSRAQTRSDRRWWRCLVNGNIAFATSWELDYLSDLV